MKNAIIILCYNDSKNTINYVNSILEYNILDKIIVVDNNSKEDEAKKLECLKNISNKLEVIRTSSNGGYAYGNNVGLKYLDEKCSDDFDYVIISNPDVFVEENSIVKTIDYMNKNKNVAIASPRMNFVTGPARRAAWKKRTFAIDIAGSVRINEFLLYPLLKKGEYTKKDYGKEVLKVDNVAGSFFVADFNKFKEVGFFDEGTFLFYEEDILSEKLIKKGYDIVLLNDINFMHYESKTIGKVMNLYRKMDILFDSKVYYHKKYNNAGIFKIMFLNILRCIRKIELLIEIPILKLRRKR